MDSLQLALFPGLDTVDDSLPDPEAPSPPRRCSRGIVREIPCQLSALPELVPDWEPRIPVLNRPVTPAQRRAEERLVRQHKPLVHKLLKDEGWRFQYCDRDDLISVGLIGLWKAVRRYDPSKGYRFSSLARTFILGEWRHYMRDSIWAIAAPGRVRTLGAKARKLLDLGIEEAQIQAQLKLSPQELEEALRATAGLHHLSEAWT